MIESRYEKAQREYTEFILSKYPVLKDNKDYFKDKPLMLNKDDCHKLDRILSKPID